ncbi:hypothetical protein F5Y16DRAFT_369360 [Xylariaceae sp. FL0255]|nr:hypothetical protein F5Y16DRAFT_369360 [Xylariaceae sp. FL0255]
MSQPHAANTSHTRVPVHTPTQSFSDALQTPDSRGIDWADKQAKDVELAKARLVDPKFNIRDYPDPLLPRQQQAPSHYLPKTSTPETEARLLEIIAQIKRKTA